MGRPGSTPTGVRAPRDGGREIGSRRVPAGALPGGAGRSDRGSSGGDELVTQRHTMLDVTKEEEIEQYLAEPKQLPWNYRDRLVPIEERRYRRADVELQGTSGRVYVIYLRQLIEFPENFSVGCYLQLPGRAFRIRRYNGGWQPHRNPIEKERFQGPHIHMATKRYQSAGYEEDKYAIPTDRFNDPPSAFRCLMEDCMIKEPLTNTEMFTWRLPW